MSRKNISLLNILLSLCSSAVSKIYELIQWFFGHKIVLVIFVGLSQWTLLETNDAYIYIQAQYQRAITDWSILSIVLAIVVGPK